MAADKFMKRNSYDFQKPSLQLFAFVLVLLGILLLVFEYLLQIPKVVSLLPPPSPGLSYPFPEVGLKFERYFNLGHVNCLFFGSSMVDAGLDPELMEKRLNNQNKRPITCINFGLSGAQVETSSEISQTMVNWQTTNLVLFGVSPYEFNEGNKISRQMANVPVFQKTHKYNFESWLFNSFRLPWFYSGLLNRKDRDFITTEQSYDKLLNSRGVRVTDEKNELETKKQEFLFHDFYPNSVDINSLDEMIKFMQEKGIKVIVFEMPVNPLFFPGLVEGGAPMYEIRFVEPIKNLLQKYGLSLIRTQPRIGDILDEEHWNNKNHMNYSGAQIFTNFVADQILQQGDW